MDGHSFVSHDFRPEEMVVYADRNVLAHKRIRTTLKHEVALPYLDLYGLSLQRGEILVKPGVECSHNGRVQRHGILRTKPEGQQYGYQQ